MEVIPKIALPPESLGQMNGAFKEEKMVSITDHFGGDIKIRPVYFEQGIEGAIAECYVRKSVADRLEEALSYLEQGTTFLVYDAWRPLQVQESLYSAYKQQIREEHPQWGEMQINIETRKFVSLPSYDLSRPSVHNTGGAIDLTICDVNTGQELPMGTDFDDFTERAYTASFEKHTTLSEKEICENRRRLYWAMIKSGFSNLPTEWWHYDYGDAFWGYYTKQSAFYKGLYKITDILQHNS